MHGHVMPDQAEPFQWSDCTHSTSPANSGSQRECLCAIRIRSPPGNFPQHLWAYTYVYPSHLVMQSVGFTSLLPNEQAWLDTYVQTLPGNT